MSLSYHEQRSFAVSAVLKVGSNASRGAVLLHGALPIPISCNWWNTVTSDLKEVLDLTAGVAEELAEDVSPAVPRPHWQRAAARR